jgi:hypothetical protein
MASYSYCKIYLKLSAYSRLITARIALFALFAPSAFAEPSARQVFAAIPVIRLVFGSLRPAHG